MVQIVNSFIAVAAVVAVTPAFAAPLIEAREPSTFKSIAKIGGRVASGASLGMSVAPLLQQQQQKREVEELEARKITSAEAKSIARGVGKAASAAKSGIEFGAAVAPLLPHKQRRSLEYDLLPRKFHSTLKTGGKLAAGTAGFAGAVVSANAQQPRDYDDGDFYARQFDDIETRRSLEYDLVPRKFHVSSSTLKTGGKLAAGAAGFAGAVVAANAQQPRDYEDGDFYARQFDDIETREPKLKLGNVMKIASNFIREDDADEFFAREPEPFKIGSLFKTVEKFIRENEDEEMFARDFDEAEIDAREPLFIGGIIKGIGKVAKNFIRETEGFDELD